MSNTVHPWRERSNVPKRKNCNTEEESDTKVVAWQSMEMFFATGIKIQFRQEEEDVVLADEERRAHCVEFFKFRLPVWWLLYYLRGTFYD